MGLESSQQNPYFSRISGRFGAGFQRKSGRNTRTAHRLGEHRQRIAASAPGYSAATGFVSDPRPSTVTVTVSPGWSQRLGVRPMPTPEGVPVETISPGSKGEIDEIYSISSG